MHSPLLIAHRGDRKYFAGNTLEGFQSAFSKGADGVEMDIQLVSGEILLIHNYMFDPKQEYISLDRVLRELSQVGRLEIEIKAFTPDIIDPLNTLLRKYAPKDIEITTSELPMVPHLTKAFPQYSVGVIFNKCHYEPWMSEELYIRKVSSYLNTLNAQVAHLSSLPEQKLTKSLVSSLQNKGYITHYHIDFMETDVQIKTYKLLQEVGINQCTFDDTDLLGHV